MLRSKRLLVVLAGLGVAIALAAQPGAGARESSSVGKVQGTEAYIAVTYDGKRLRAYACDGSERRPATIAAWFEAPWDGRAPIEVVAADGTRLQVDAVRDDGRIHGRLDGHRFSATPATGPAGLVQGDGRRSVVLPDGSVRGAFVNPRPIKCRPVMTTLADGTTQIVTVCRSA